MGGGEPGGRSVPPLGNQAPIMDLQHYHEFQRLQAQGRKPEARAALERFITSAGRGEERQAWVREYLERGDYGHRIRHELYESLIFPVLLDGYRSGDVWSTLWLARTAQNLYASSTLHALVELKSEQQLLREAHELDPSDEAVRESLLAALVKWFAYSQHEWPAGILWGRTERVLSSARRSWRRSGSPEP